VVNGRHPLHVHSHPVAADNQRSKNILHIMLKARHDALLGHPPDLDIHNDRLKGKKRHKADDKAQCQARTQRSHVASGSNI